MKSGDWSYEIISWKFHLALCILTDENKYKVTWILFSNILKKSRKVFIKRTEMKRCHSVLFISV